jgi:endonuclease/exonuclease/phosphatase family metal-dependent hydrolase
MTEKELKQKTKLPSILITLFGAVVLIILGVSAVYLSTRRHVYSYVDPEAPKFEGRHAAQPSAKPASIVVVAYNIKYGRAVAEALQVVQTSGQLQDADIILLQEMDETGVEQIARALRYNYVYYPASVAPGGRNVGNAVLTRWPITETRKVVLPHRHPLTRQARVATRATIDLSGEYVDVYSVHTATYSALASQREAQVQAIVDDIGMGDDPVIVGGDFNTASGRSVRRTAEQFADSGLTRVSAGVGPTFSVFGVGLAATDHIFVRGFSKIASGKVETAGASDHFPVWVHLGTSTEEEK